MVGRSNESDVQLDDSSTANRRGPNKERAASTRALVVDVAGELFAKNGYANTSLSKVAEACDLTKGALYHHFSDKLALLEAVVVDSQARLADHVLAAAVDTLSTPEWLEVSLDAYLAGCLDPKVRPWLLFIESPAALGVDKWNEIDQSFFRDIALDGITRILGESASVPPNILCDVLYAYLTDAAVRAVTADDPEAMNDETKEHVLAIIDAVASSQPTT